MKQKILSSLLLVSYLVILTWIIIFKISFNLDELTTERIINWVPYGASAVINGQIDRQELIYNILIYVPFGLLLSLTFPRMKFLSKLLLIVISSVVFESVQYYLAIGGSDITDVINNSLGGLIGLILYDLLELIFRKKARLNHFILTIGWIGILGSLLFAGYLYMNR